MTKQLIKYGVTPWAELADSREEVETDMREGLRWLQHTTKLGDSAACLLFLLYDDAGAVVGLRMVLTEIQTDYTLLYDAHGLTLYAIEYAIDVIGEQPCYDITEIEEVVDGEYDDLPTMIGTMVSIYFNEVLCED